MNPSETLPASSVSVENVEQRVRAACSRIAPVWPLENFVAVNPYLGLTEYRFGDAAAVLATVAGANTTMPTTFYLDAIDAGRIIADDVATALAVDGRSSSVDVASFLDQVRRGSGQESPTTRVPTVTRIASAHTGQDWSRLATDRISAWAAAYFDGGQTSWRSADQNEPLFAAWKHEASVDRTPEIMGLSGFRAAVQQLPDDPIEAIEYALRELHIPEAALESYLHAVLMQVGGWAAHAARIVWEHGLLGDENDTVVQFLAVLLGWELGIFGALSGQGLDEAWAAATTELGAVEAPADAGGTLYQRLVLQDAYDNAEQRRIIAQLGFRATTEAVATASDGSASPTRPRAQAVFCIDVRSEVFRRHLEATAPDVDTIGFAGFFGFAIEYIPIAHDRGENQCPVLLSPGYTVLETVSDQTRNDEAIESRRLRHQVERSWKSFKMGAISCFSFVGPVGLAYLPKMFSDSFGWTRPAPRPEDEGLATWAIDQKGPSLETGPANVGIALEDRINLAEGALRGMSMTEGLAPLVMILGHGATTVNNPYDTGLDCGACGGHTGEANGRVAAAILNDPEVRASLVERGISVPDDTWFVAGQHNTTTDEITLFDLAAVPADHAGPLAALTAELADAGARSRVERARRMGIASDQSVDAAVMRRSNDWSQVRPEWGLAGCRTFIVAPRNRTADLNLSGRSFLHSYDWRQDSGFGVLELIMTAPMVVASWISLQYYASTVDNQLFGSGNKTLHNVVGRIGVLEGNSGDLRVGLPWQSVHDGEILQHEPLRLNVIIEAPIEAMNDVLAAHGGVNDLCENGWLQLLAMDDSGSVSHRYVGGLRWDPVAS